MPGEIPAKIAITTETILAKILNLIKL